MFFVMFLFRIHVSHSYVAVENMHDFVSTIRNFVLLVSSLPQDVLWRAGEAM